MKKVTLAMIIVWSLVAVAIIGAIVVGITRGGNFVLFSWMDANNRELLIEQTFPVTDYNKISLSLSSDDVTIFLTDEQEIRVKQYGINWPESRIIKFSTHGSELRISENSSINDFGTWFVFGNRGSWIELYIPESYKDALDINLGSGSVKVTDNLDLSSLKVRLSSGSFRSDYFIKALNTDITITSGTIRLLGGLDSNSCDISTSSGSITIEQVLSISGAIEVTSGTVRLEGVDIKNDLRVRVTSGTVNLRMANDPGLEFNAEVSSGTVNTYFDTTSSGTVGKKKTASFGPEPRKRLDIKVTSGTVNVRQ